MITDICSHQVEYKYNANIKTIFDVNNPFVNNIINIIVYKFTNSLKSDFSLCKSGKSLNSVSPETDPSDISLFNQQVFADDKNGKTSTLPSPPSSYDWQTAVLPPVLCFPSHRNQITSASGPCRKSSSSGGSGRLTQKYVNVHNARVLISVIFPRRLSGV